MTIKQQGGIFGRNPTFNDVEVEGTLTATGTVSVPADSISGNAIDGGTATLDGLTVDTTTFHVDSSNNRIGVGTTSPIAVVDIDMGAGGARRLLANYDDSIVSLKSSNASANPETLRLIGGNIRFNTGGSGSGSEIARVTDNGITFNGDTSSDNALSDYEQGTWTPVLTGSGSNPTGTVVAKYTKVGQVVSVEGKYTFSTAGSGNYALTFASLPFTVAASRLTGTLSLLDAGTAWYQGALSGDGTNITFSTTGGTAFTNTAPFTVAASDELNFNFTYVTS